MHAFAYTVTIRNTGDVTGAADRAPLDHQRRQRPASRKCAASRVVGHQPLLKPGEQFEYTSWTPPRRRRSGTMHGTYFCMTEDAHPFEAPVGEFALTLASALALTMSWWRALVGGPPGGTCPRC